MPDFIKKILGSASLPEQLPEELKTILSLMRHERNAFAALAQRAEASLSTAQGLLEPGEQMKQAVGALEERLGRVETVAPQIAALSAQAEWLSETCGETHSQVSETVSTVTEVRSELADMQDLLRGVRSLKEDVTGFLELGGRFRALREEAETFAAQLTEIRQQSARAGEEHDAVGRRSAAVSSRLGDLEARVEAVYARFEGAEQGVAHLQGSLAPVSQLVAGLPDLRRELGTVNALGDYVKQNLPMLEQQCEAVDRAAAQCERLNEVARQVDRGIQQQRENAAFLTQIGDELSELRALQSELIEECDNITARHEQIESQDEASRHELQEFHDKLTSEWRQAVGRLEFEREGLDTVTQRVLELGAALTEAERQSENVHDVTETMSRLQSDVSHLAGLVASLANDVADLDTQAERVRGLQDDIRRADQSISDVAARLEALRMPLGADLEDREERAQELEAALGILGHRSQQLEGFVERATGVGQEIERRQGAIEDALRDLEVARELRSEAAAAAEDLRVQVTSLRDALAATDERMSQVDDLFEQFEARTAILEVAHQRIIRLEEQLVSWESMEAKVDLALEQAEHRRSAVETLRADIHRLFETADRTLQDVRSIAASREEIKEGRELVETVLSRVGDARQQVEALDERRHQIAEVEERLTRLDALVVDIDTGLQSMEGQRAFLGQVLETARSLRFQSKQAEALIETLREERERAIAQCSASSPNRLRRPSQSPTGDDETPQVELVK